MKEILDNWNMMQKIIAFGFGTMQLYAQTPESTRKAAATTGETDLLWPACRHHIPERIIQAVSFTTLFGSLGRLRGLMVLSSKP